MSHLGTSLSQTALAHWTMGSMAISPPASYPASCSLANVDLPLISPKAPQLKDLTFLMAESVAP